MTKDHSQVQQLVDGGIIKPEDADDHPDSNIITRSIGSKPEIKADIRPEPETILPGDKFLLCTDGLTGMIKDAEIQAILEQNDPMDTTCDNLIQAALNNGGHDNVTVQLIYFDKNTSEESLDETAPVDNNEVKRKSGMPIITLAIPIIAVLLIVGISWHVIQSKKDTKTQEIKGQQSGHTTSSTSSTTNNTSNVKDNSQSLNQEQYDIKNGDTITKIAKQRNVPVEKIVELNKDKLKNIKPEDDLKKKGVQLLIVPKISD
jgi:LysM repeat protein